MWNIYDWDWVDWAVGIFMAVCLVAGVALIVLMYIEHDQCTKRGGKMVQDGYTYITTMTNFGNGVYIPITTMQPTYSCNVKAGETK